MMQASVLSANIAEFTLVTSQLSAAHSRKGLAGAHSFQGQRLDSSFNSRSLVQVSKRSRKRLVAQVSTPSERSLAKGGETVVANGKELLKLDNGHGRLNGNESVSNGVTTSGVSEAAPPTAEKDVLKLAPKPEIRPPPKPPVLTPPVRPAAPTPRDSPRADNSQNGRKSDRPGVWRRDRDGAPAPRPVEQQRPKTPDNTDRVASDSYKVVYRPAERKARVVGAEISVEDAESGAGSDERPSPRPVGQGFRPSAARAGLDAPEGSRPTGEGSRLQLERPPAKHVERPVRLERPAAPIDRPGMYRRGAGTVPPPAAAGPGGAAARAGAPSSSGAGPAGDKWGARKPGTDAAKRRVRRTPGVGGRRDEDDDGRGMLAAMGVKIEGMQTQRPTKRRKGRSFRARQRAAARAAKEGTPIRVEILEVPPQGMSVEELAQQLAVDETEIIKSLFMKGIMATVNQTLDEDTVKVVCAEYDVEVLEAGSARPEDMAKKTFEFLDDEDLESLQPRPPVVTIMGHVDHGKTSLLDYIRKTKVAKGEAGGITQSIGAYKVMVPVAGEDQTCVFLDTPGHEAFSAMRARGARVTDIAIIVVAADDGVRPQSLEAISHAKAAGVPIIIAINKVDKEGASVERVQQELSAQGLMPEEWGGTTPMVAVSAKQGTGVDDLLETVMLVAEMEDLQANPERAPKGTVIEASLDRKRGPLATVLVQAGTLRRGDVILCGEAWGKVRSLYDDAGAMVDEAGPSMAVQVLGLSTVPAAGDIFEGCASLEEARTRAETLAMELRTQRLAMQSGESAVSLQSLAAAAQVQEQGLEFGSINLILKVDNAGTIEAVRAALDSLPQDTVKLRYLLTSPGEVSVSDVDLAVASKAVVVGFNVASGNGVESHAKDMGVEIRNYNVIYDLVNDMRAAMEGMLEPEEDRIPLGAAEVRAIFGAGSGKAAGCMVTEGKLVKGCHVAVVRKGKEVYTGALDSLRRIKEMVKEVPQGLECGVSIEAFTEWREGDKIEAYEIVMKTRTLESASEIASKALGAVASGAGMKQE